jgi:predicted DNA repair protein MutK
MAGAGFFTLLDDIASLLDDIAGMSKMAVEKTAGVIGDDLALNAQQVTGISTNRELPVVWAVAKGSLLNKAILVPLALLISWLANWAVKPLLMIGGAYLCYEGVEKILHKFFHHSDEHPAEHPGEPTNAERIEALQDPEVDLLALEKERIWGAIRTDFILSAEIIVISLGVFAAEPLYKQLGAFIVISLAMTIGVYGLVAAIVKLDDLGLRWINKKNPVQKKLGKGILWFAPWLLKFLSVAGTLAMFLVGGEIIMHGIAPLYDQVHHWSEAAGKLPLVGWLTGSLLELAIAIVVGVLTGLCVLGLVQGGKLLWRKKA